MLLDTNIVSAFLRRDARKRTPKLFEFVAALLSADGLAISYVTQFELRRGMEQLVRRGEGRRKLVDFEKFLERVQVLGLDGALGEGWNLAARLWAEGRAQKPALVVTDADLLMATTAAFHGHELATADAGLAEGLRRLAFPVGVTLVPME
jgi:predicted nucleic acid-binding protein